jgi:hypothetical protein
VRDHHHSKLTTCSHLIRRERCSANCWSQLAPCKLDMSLKRNYEYSSWQTPSNIMPKLTNNPKFGVTSTSWQSPSKLMQKLPTNWNLVTKSLPFGGKFLIRDQPHSKLVTFSYLCRRELFKECFGHLQIRYELVVKLCIKLMKSSLHDQLTVANNSKWGKTSTSRQSPVKLKFFD